MNPSTQNATQARDVATALFPETPLLRDLPPVILMKLRTKLEFFRFTAGHRLQKAGDPAHHLIFLESGLVSLITGKDAIEVALLGKGDVVGMTAILGDTTASATAIAHVDGSAWRLPSRSFAETAESDPELRRRFDPYLLSVLRARSASVAAAARCTVRERLAAWLDRAFELQGTDSVRITHENLAAALGVRRPGVTVALHELEGERTIRAVRGRIQLRDRDLLRSQARRALGSI